MLNPCSNEAAEELEGDLEDNLLGDSDAAGVSDAVDAVQDADIVQQHGQNAAYILQPCENPRFSTWAAVAEPLPMSQPCYQYQPFAKVFSWLRTPLQTQIFLSKSFCEHQPLSDCLPALCRLLRDLYCAPF